MLIDPNRYFIGWISLLTDAQGRGTVQFPIDVAEEICTDLNKRYIGSVDHFVIAGVDVINEAIDRAASEHVERE